MYIEVCLTILIVIMIGLVFFLVRIYSQILQSSKSIQADARTLFKEVTHLVNSVNAFVQDDLHDATQEARQLISKLNDLSSDLNNKSHSLNFLFKPLGFLNSKISGEDSVREPTSKSETIPQILKWIGSSAILIKTTTEFIKNHEKRT